MNPQRVFDFFKTPAGKLVGFIGLVALVLILGRGCQSDTPISSRASRTNSVPIADSERRSISPITPANVAPTPATTRADTPALPPITLYGDLGAESDFSEVSAPFGSMIPCWLVQTVDSSDAETPIVALTTEDLVHRGEVVIPKGSEVHGRARPGRSRDRVHSESTWTMVWPTGEQLTVSGLALDQDRLPEGGWGSTDGSAGLRGQLIRSDNWAELKLFASTFLAGTAQAVEERQATAFGAQVVPHAKNAALQGTTEVLNRYSAQVVERLEREAFIVRVPSGKPFYLYVTQPIERGKARLGGARPSSISTTVQKSIP